jgi:hypothetical protein
MAICGLVMVGVCVSVGYWGAGPVIDCLAAWTGGLTEVIQQIHTAEERLHVLQQVLASRCELATRQAHNTTKWWVTEILR